MSTVSSFSVSFSQNSDHASIFVLKTEQGDIHEGGRFNIELAASGSQPALLVETEIFPGANPGHCSLHNLVAKPASLSRAIDRYQQIEQESSGAEESTPQSSVDYANFSFNIGFYRIFIIFFLHLSATVSYYLVDTLSIKIKITLKFVQNFN